MLTYALIPSLWLTVAFASSKSPSPDVIQIPATVRSGWAETDGVKHCDFSLSRQVDGTWKIELDVDGESGELFGRTVALEAGALPLREGWSESGLADSARWRYGYANSVLTIEDEYWSATSLTRTRFEITVEPMLRRPTRIRIHQFAGPREDAVVTCDPGSS